MAGSFLDMAGRLTAAGHDPALAPDLERTLARLSGRLGRSLLMAGPEGVAYWFVTEVDLEAMTVTLVCDDRTMTAGPEDLCALFGTSDQTH